MSDVYERLFHLSRDLLCTATLQGFFVELSPSWQETLGFTLDEVRNEKELPKHFPHDELSALQADLDLRRGKHLLRDEPVVRLL